ncbi:hypothetical protein D9C83_04880, partial [Salinibacterium amurskyense]
MAVAVLASLLFTVGATNAASASAQVSIESANSSLSQLADPSAAQSSLFQANSGSNFDPGYIISDAYFYKSGDMSQSQIQAFLDSMLDSCDNSNCLTIKRTTTFSRDADRTVCGPYTGASNELTSAIIYKVQQACGISAKVLLVMLQKEQGLLTNDEPSDSRLARAMGYGCPDNVGGVCDAEYYGLYNQLYNAAWQLKRYSTPTAWGYYQPGVKSILYHPNTSCGSKSVNIQNNATAALYNYTPYVPNAAALANLGGYGDSCSSYGNRNFWDYFTAWFGSTTGAPVYTVDDPDIAAYYETRTTALGSPTSATSTYETVNGDGAVQHFAKAHVYSSDAGVFTVSFAFRDESVAQGGIRGILGWPIGEQSCVSGSCSQQFQNGALYQASSNTAVYSILDSAIVDYYDAKPTALGWPAADTVFYDTVNGSGLVQRFNYAQVYSSDAGVFALSKAFRDASVAQGGINGVMGWPAAEMVCVSDSCSQQFQHGALYQASSSSAVYAITDSAISAYYSTRIATLGKPTLDTRSYATVNGKGTVQRFEKAQVYSTDAGVFSLSKAFRDGSVAQGGINGVLGWPVAEMICESGSCSQEFQHGALYQASSNSAVYAITDSAIADYYGARISELGLPTLDTRFYETVNGSGAVQRFEDAQVYSSSAGVFTLNWDFRGGSVAQGGINGALGWPVAEMICESGSCSQEFQHGALYQASSNSAVYAITDSAIADYYGARISELGLPTLDTRFYETVNGSGAVQRFEDAQVYSSSAGVFTLNWDFR